MSLIICKDMNLVFTNPKMLERLRLLTLRPASGMNQELDNLLNIYAQRPIKAKALCLYEKSELVAWALLSEETSKYSFSIQNHDSNLETLFEIYVKPIHRRKGYGAKLLEKARSISKNNLCIAPWSFSSEKFFQNCGNPNDVHLSSRW